jgi:hypothetical protein
MIPEKVQDAWNTIRLNAEEAANHITGGALIMGFKNLGIHRVRHCTWKSEFFIKKLNLTGRDRKNSGIGFLDAVYIPSISLEIWTRGPKIMMSPNRCGEIIPCHFINRNLSDLEIYWWTIVWQILSRLPLPVEWVFVPGNHTRSLISMTSFLMCEASGESDFSQRGINISETAGISFQISGPPNHIGIRPEFCLRLPTRRPRRTRNVSFKTRARPGKHRYRFVSAKSPRKMSVEYPAAWNVR